MLLLNLLLLIHVALLVYCCLKIVLVLHHLNFSVKFTALRMVILLGLHPQFVLAFQRDGPQVQGPASSIGRLYYFIANLLRERYIPIRCGPPFTLNWSINLIKLSES